MRALSKDEIPLVIIIAAYILFHKWSGPPWFAVLSECISFIICAGVFLVSRKMMNSILRRERSELLPVPSKAKRLAYGTMIAIMGLSLFFRTWQETFAGFFTAIICSGSLLIFSSEMMRQFHFRGRRAKLPETGLDRTR